MRRLVTFLGTAALWLARIGESQTVLTFDRVLELARTQNPEVLVARAREAEAEGRLGTARVRLATNPEVDFFGGRRELYEETAAELDLAVTQRFETGGQRGLRISAAGALIEQRRAETAVVSLEATAVAASAFYRALHAQQLKDVVEQAARLADEMLSAAEARFEAGETTLLELNLARVEQARSARDALAAEALVERSYGELRTVLALLPTTLLRVQGVWPRGDDPPLDRLLAALRERPDIRALAAAVAGAESEWRLARAESRPDLVAGVGFRREQTERIVGALVGVSLPLFQRNAGLIASALARIERERLALDARRRANETRLLAAYAQYVAARDAATLIREGGLPHLEENETLAAESYRAGKIGVVDLLVIRRETVAARREVLEAELHLATAIVELRVAGGSLP